MNLDWAIAISVFLVFIGLGFAYYWGLFESSPDYIGASLEDANRKVLGFLSVDSWRVPVRYSSQESGLAVLYFDFSWPEGAKNSTRILDSGLEMDCMLQGDRLYFQAYADTGDNDFEMVFANVSSPVLCDSLLETAGANASVPWTSEKSRRISRSKVDQMLATDYSQFRQSLGIARNFRVEAGSSSYGPSSPGYTNTYVKETHSLTLETGQPVSVRVAVW